MPMVKPNFSMPEEFLELLDTVGEESRSTSDDDDLVKPDGTINRSIVLRDLMCKADQRFADALKSYEAVSS